MTTKLLNSFVVVKPIISPNGCGFRSHEMFGLTHGIMTASNLNQGIFQSDFQIFLQWIEAWLAEVVLNWSVTQALPGELQAKLFAFLSLLQLPVVKPGDATVCSLLVISDEVTTQLTNGLHYRRGIQNMQVYDMEWLIRVPLKAAPVASTSTSEVLVQRDWTTTQKAWWDGILLMEENPSVVRVALEMRIVGGSDLFLAPQRENTIGTTIEYLTTLNTPLEDWVDICHKISDKWVSYTDPTTGKRLPAKPHWAKQWSFLTLPDEKGLPLKSFPWAHTMYKEEISLFMDALKKMGESAQFSVDDLRARFGNEFLEAILWNTGDPATDIKESDDISRRVKKLLKSCFSWTLFGKFFRSVDSKAFGQ